MDELKVNKCGKADLSTLKVRSFGKIIKIMVEQGKARHVLCKKEDNFNNSIPT